MEAATNVSEALSRLRKKLDEFHYDEIQMSLRGINYFFDPFPDYSSFEENINTLPRNQRLLYELFLLGNSLPVENVEEVLTKRDIDNLAEIGLLRCNCDVVDTNELSIASFLGHYFIANIPPHYPTCRRRKTAIHISPGSYILAYNLNVPRGSYVLDICAGTGIQSIVCSHRTRKVVAVELEDASVRAATYNTILNDVEDSVEIRKGDLYEPVNGERFDFICSTPPLMPVPVGVNYNVVGDGGLDGLQIFNRILDGLDEHLTPEGRCIIGGEAIGGTAHPFFAEKLMELSKKRNWCTTLLLRSRQPLSYQAYLTANLAAEVNEISKDQLILMWKQLYTHLGADYMYDFITFINKTSYSDFRVIDLCNKWTIRDKPILYKQVEFERGNLFYIRKQGQYVKRANQNVFIPERTYNLMKYCDGKRNVEEVVKEVYQRLGPFEVDRALTNTLELFKSLEEMQIVQRMAGEVRVSGEETSVPLRKKIEETFKFKGKKI